jgi:hypothetical protein
VDALSGVVAVHLTSVPVAIVVTASRCCTPTRFPLSPRTPRSRGETGRSRRRSHTGRARTGGRMLVCRIARCQGQGFARHHNTARPDRSPNARRRPLSGGSRGRLPRRQRTPPRYTFAPSVCCTGRAHNKPEYRLHRDRVRK